MRELAMFQDCPCSGRNLPRLVQPAMMAYLAKEDLHGYRLLDMLKQEPAFHEQPPDQAGVYRILRNMEQEGLVESAWDTEGAGPARKRYRLTERGRSCLREWRRTLTDYQAGIAALIRLLPDD